MLSEKTGTQNELEKEMKKLRWSWLLLLLKQSFNTKSPIKNSSYKCTCVWNQAGKKFCSISSILVLANCCDGEVRTDGELEKALCKTGQKKHKNKKIPAKITQGLGHLVRLKKQQIFLGFFFCVFYVRWCLSIRAEAISNNVNSPTYSLHIWNHDDIDIEWENKRHIRFLNFLTKIFLTDDFGVQRGKSFFD